MTTEITEEYVSFKRTNTREQFAYAIRAKEFIATRDQLRTMLLNRQIRPGHNYNRGEVTETAFTEACHACGIDPQPLIAAERSAKQAKVKQGKENGLRERVQFLRKCGYRVIGPDGVEV